jgi:hypothetical protein
MRTYLFAISRFIEPINLWTLGGVTYPLENGGLPCIRPSDNEDPELDSLGDWREIRDLRDVESWKIRDLREFGDLRETREFGNLGEFGDWREILMWILSTKAFVREKSGQGVELG